VIVLAAANTKGGPEVNELSQPAATIQPFGEPHRFDGAANVYALVLRSAAVEERQGCGMKYRLDIVAQPLEDLLLHSAGRSGDVAIHNRYAIAKVVRQVQALEKAPRALLARLGTLAPHQQIHAVLGAGQQSPQQLSAKRPGRARDQDRFLH